MTQKQLKVYRGHHAGISGLAWSADCKKLASLDVNGEIHILDTLGTKPLHQLQSEIPSHRVGGMAFSPQGDELACAEEGGIVRWDLKSEQPSEHLPFDYTAMLRYSPQGTYLAAADREGTVVVWKTDAQSEHFRVPTNGKMRAIRFTPDESLILVEQGRLEVWDCAKKEKQREHIFSDVKFATLHKRSPGHDLPLCEVSPSGKHCLICTLEGAVRLDLATRKKQVRPVDRFRGSFVSLSVSPRLDRCALVGREIRIVHFQGGSTGKPFGFASLFYGDGWRPPRILADRYLKCRHLVAHNRNGWYPCWDLSTGGMLTGFPEDAHIDERGQLRAVVDDRIEFWPSPQDLNLNSQTIARLKDAQDAIGWNKRSTRSFNWTQDGSTLWSWWIKGEKAMVRFWNASDGTVSRTIDITGFGFIRDVHSESHLSADARLLVLSGTVNYKNKNVIQTWETTAKNRTRQFDTGLVDVGLYDLSISSTGRWLAANNGFTVDPITLWRCDDGQKMGELKTKEARDGFRLQFSRSDKYLLTGRKVWEVESRKLLWECPEPSHASGPSRDYRAAHLFDDERHILIQQDAQYQIWDWKKNKNRATIFLLPNRYWAFFNHETGHYTGSVLAFQYLRFRHTDKTGKHAWLSRSQYEKQTGWKNDPSKAGLRDLAKRPSGK